MPFKLPSSRRRSTNTVTKKSTSTKDQATATRTTTNACFPSPPNSRSTSTNRNWSRYSRGSSRSSKSFSSCSNSSSPLAELLEVTPRGKSCNDDISSIFGSAADDTSSYNRDADEAFLSDVASKIPTKPALSSASHAELDLLLDTIALADENNKDTFTFAEDINLGNGSAASLRHDSSYNENTKNRKNKASTTKDPHNDKTRKRRNKPTNFLKGIARASQHTSVQKAPAKQEKALDTVTANSNSSIYSGTDTTKNCVWRTHDPSTSAEASVLFPTLGRDAALMAHTVGLSLLTTAPKDDEAWADPLPPDFMVQESLERHISVCISHGRPCATATTVAEETYSEPVDEDEEDIVVDDPSVADDAALRYLAKGRIEKASEVFHQLLDCQHKQRTTSTPRSRTTADFNIAKTKSRLAVVSLLKDETRDAWQYTTSARQEHKKSGRTVHITLANMELGLVYFQSHLLSKSLQSYREALHLACMTLGYEHFQVAILLNNIGCLHYYLGNFSSSLRVFEESLGLQRQLLRSSTQCTLMDMPLFQMATTLGNLGLLAVKCKSYDCAVNYLEEAIAVHDSVVSTPDRVKDVTETCLIHFAQLGACNNSDEPGSVVYGGDVRGLSSVIRETFTTSSSTSINSILQPTIQIFGDPDGIPLRYDGSKSHHYLRSQVDGGQDDDNYDCILLGSLVKPASARHRVHATVVSSLDRVARTSQTGLLLLNDGNLFARKKHSLKVDVDAENIIDAEFNLSAIHMQALDHVYRKEYKDALDVFEGALKNFKEKYGDIHPLVGTGLHNCGIVHLAAQQYEHAKLCFQEALGVRAAALGDSHPDVAVSKFKLGMVQLAEGETQTALATFMDVMRLHQKNTSSYGFCLESKMLNNIGCVLYEMGLDAEAFYRCFGAFQVLRKLHKDTYDASIERALANTLMNLGYIYARQGQFGDSLVAFKETMAILCKYYPVDHPLVVTTEENMAHVKAYGAIDDNECKPTSTSKILGSCNNIRCNDRNSNLGACFHLQ